MSAIDLRRETLMESLAELDQAIEAAAQILRISRECGFQDCVAAITEDIKQVIAPNCLLLLCASVGNQRRAVARPYRKLLRMITQPE
jgi:hypothetical protein